MAPPPLWLAKNETGAPRRREGILLAFSALSVRTELLITWSGGEALRTADKGDPRLTSRDVLFTWVIVWCWETVPRASEAKFLTPRAKNDDHEVWFEWTIRIVR